MPWKQQEPADLKGLDAGAGQGVRAAAPRKTMPGSNLDPHGLGTGRRPAIGSIKRQIFFRERAAVAAKRDVHGPD